MLLQTKLTRIDNWCAPMARSFGPQVAPLWSTIARSIRGVHSPMTKYGVPSVLMAIDGATRRASTISATGSRSGTTSSTAGTTRTATTDSSQFCLHLSGDSRAEWLLFAHAIDFRRCEYSREPCGLVLFHYIGDHIIGAEVSDSTPHGNAKRTSQPFLRTLPIILQEVKEQTIVSSNAVEVNFFAKLLEMFCAMAYRESNCLSPAFSAQKKGRMRKAESSGANTSRASPRLC
ncbi:unnamed protein product [Gongylonema pulchrum]|uniref:Uncharacterized protein n=1 Tax=Gongylonema pulchrum TaxID=637853 RepID=A0A183EKM3_9BILA|nr:unnamed protein product [Gongylonema pulchrum]